MATKLCGSVRAKVRTSNEGQPSSQLTSLPLSTGLSRRLEDSSPRKKRARVAQLPDERKEINDGSRRCDRHWWP
jgi:hypothetical protein